MKRFYILGFDANGTPNGVVGKKTWDNRDDAEKHAVEVLKSQPNTPSFEIVETTAIVKRISSPIEVIHLDEPALVREAA